MYNYSNNGVLIKSIIDERRELVGGGYPIKIRVTFKRKQKYYNTGVALSPDQWKAIPDTKKKKEAKQRDIIQTTFEKIKEKSEQLIKEDSFSFLGLETRLGHGVSDSVNIVYEDRIRELNNEGKHNTADWYKYSLKAVNQYAGGFIDPKSVNVEWLKSFEDHLLDKKKSYTTVSMYMRALKAIMNIILERGVLKQNEYPFGDKKNKYQIPQHSSRKIALPIKKIGEIVNYECMNETERFYRDLWFFSYLCNGANVTDILQFTKDNLKADSIQFYRQKTLASSKTKKLIIATLTQEMKVILKEHGSKDVDAKYLFPILDGNETSIEKLKKIKGFTRSMNHYLSKIGKELNIGKVSTYTARHSYATVLKRSGASIAFISESLGHSDMKVTENYLASFEDEERNRNAKLLTNF